MPPKTNVEVSIAPLNAATTQELVSDPLDDKELRAVLGRHAKIVPYHKLSQYQSIDELLPKPKDAAVLLYENRQMDGHWVCLTKNNGEISFFDPYGEVIDKQLQYSKYSQARVVGNGDTTLHALLSTSKLPVYYNNYKYQRDGQGVNTCGRHVANFIRYNQEDGLDLEDYNEMMTKTQKQTGLPYDELIAKMVPIHIPHPDDDIQRGFGAARPLNPSLWNEVKAYTRTRFPKWSAYASGFAAKIYKDKGGKWEDDGKGRPLQRWFKEVWTDVGGRDYPVFRPTKRVSKDTPLTASEVSPANLRKQVALKQRLRGKKNLPAFVGGAKSEEEKRAYAREYYRTVVVPKKRAEAEARVARERKKYDEVMSKKSPAERAYYEERNREMVRKRDEEFAAAKEAAELEKETRMFEAKGDIFKKRVRMYDELYPIVRGEIVVQGEDGVERILAPSQIEKNKREYLEAFTDEDWKNVEKKLAVKKRDEAYRQRMKEEAEQAAFNARMDEQEGLAAEEKRRKHREYYERNRDKLAAATAKKKAENPKPKKKTKAELKAEADFKRATARMTPKQIEDYIKQREVDAEMFEAMFKYR
jgi:hypothetical protein